MKEIIGKMDKVLVGDRLLLVDRLPSGDNRKILVEVIEIRHILGAQTCDVEIEKGSRKLVSESQVGIESLK